MKHIYFVGAPTTEKGLEDFNEIAQCVKQAKFYWYCFYVSTEIAKKYNHINFIVGRNDTELKKEIHNKMDLFICCSRFEGFCLPIAEAMILKIPVISYALDEIKAEFRDTIAYADTKEQLKIKVINFVLKNEYTKDVSLAKLFIEKNYFPDKVADRLMKIITMNL